MKTTLFANKAVTQIVVVKINERDCFSSPDDVSIEEPLEIRVSYLNGQEVVKRTIAVTMRTPGNDAELAVGFLFTEGIISDQQHLANVYHVQAECSRTADNVIMVELQAGFIPYLANAERNFYTTSSCGVCGKGSIASIRTVSAYLHQKRKVQIYKKDTLYQLPEKLKYGQENFSATGGIHASGLFDLNGNLVLLQEDVGKHNALDKLIGQALAAGLIPLNRYILVLSGRASFELIQKAAMAGITIVAAIGAPSSLAVDLAKEFDITLLGFLRHNRANIYYASRYCKIE